MELQCPENERMNECLSASKLYINFIILKLYQTTHSYHNIEVEIVSISTDVYFDIGKMTQQISRPHYPIGS